MAEITQVAVRFSESVKKTTKNNNSSSTKEKRKKLFLFTKDTNFQGRYGPRKIPGPKLRVVEIETQFFLRRNSSLHVCAHEREGVFVCQWETVGLHVLQNADPKMWHQDDKGYLAGHAASRRLVRAAICSCRELAYRLQPLQSLHRTWFAALRLSPTRWNFDS